MNASKSRASDLHYKDSAFLCTPLCFLLPLVNVAEIRVLLVCQVLESMDVPFILRSSSVSLLVEAGQVKPQGDDDEQ